MSQSAITVSGLGKCFRIHALADRRFSRQAVSWLWKDHQTRALWALRNVDLRVDCGESLGIIGPNGAGKSTLLLILAGLLLPTEGSVRVLGKVNPFFHISSGLHSDLTVMDNIRLAAALFGMTRNRFKSAFDSIVAFGGLEDYLHARLGELSSGYQSRIPFSAALHAEIDILMIDEVFAVGDRDFRLRCLERMSRLRDEGKTFVFASHDMELIRSFCSRAICLEKGGLTAEGSAEEVVAEYLEDKFDKIRI